MASVIAAQHSQVTIPKRYENSRIAAENDRVNMKGVEGNKIVIEKADNKVWKTGRLFT